MIKKENRISDLRTDHDLNHNQIAEILNVKNNTYTQWEIGRNDMPIKKANELSNYYEVSLDYLLGLSNVKYIEESKDINLDIMCKRLRELRIEKHLTQEKLGKKVGFVQTTYTCYENGTSTPTTFKLLLFAKFYNVSFDYLVGKSNIKEIAKKKKYQIN